MYEILKNQRGLLIELIRREFTSTYRGSIGGLFWPILQPVLMLIVYSFTFGYILKARGGLSDNNTTYVLLLFSGLIVHHAFAETINKSVRLILTNHNLVKKVVFPLEILPITLCFSILMNLGISVLILFLAVIISSGLPDWNFLWTPLVIFTFIPSLLAVGWLLAAMGVFIRDISRITGLLTHAMLFLSPVLYKIGNAPEILQILLRINPITVIIEQLREVIIYSRTPDFIALGTYFLISTICAVVTYLLFMRFKSIFADML